MKNVLLCIISLGILLNPLQGDSNTDRVPYYIASAARHFDVEVSLMYAICRVESLCKVNAFNKNDGNKMQKAKGKLVPSHGLFQIQLATAVGLGFVRYETVVEYTVRKGKIKKSVHIIDHKKDLFKPEINSYYAAKLIRLLMDRYDGDMIKAVSAYNAGRYIRSNKAYVHKVMKNYVEYKMVHKL